MVFKRELLRVTFDVVDCLTNGGDFLSLVVRNGNVEFLFEFHDKLHGIQRVRTQIVGEASLTSYFCFFNAKFVNDDGCGLSGYRGAYHGIRKGIQYCHPG